MQFEPTWESLRQWSLPDWCQDAKFGIFIHWGIYSVPAFENEWYPRNMYQQGSPASEHHRKIWGDQAKFGYKDFIPMFKGEKFEATEWLRLFKAAGVKFIIPVAEHHDGFAMYDSALTRWNAVAMGPRRDVIGELAAAAREAGMVFGASSHRAEHWWFFNGGREFDSDVQDPRFFDLYGPATRTGSINDPGWGSRDCIWRPDAAFLEDWLARSCEVVDKYRPQLFWFDWWIDQLAFEPYLQHFAAHYYNRGQEWGQEVAVCYKHKAFPPGTALPIYGERAWVQDLRASFGQEDTVLSTGSWGFVENQPYKSTANLLSNLINNVSKNASLTVNVGPRADGTIPEKEQQILAEIGRWLAVNGEAIYATRPWKICGEGPTALTKPPKKFDASQLDDIRQPAFTSRDIRFTTKGDILYAIVLGRPADGVVRIESLSPARRLYPGTIRKVSLLGTDAPVLWSVDENGLNVTLPGGQPVLDIFALRICGDVFSLRV